MPQPVLHIAQAPAADPDAWDRLARELGPEPLALVIVLAAPSAPLERMPAGFGSGAPVIGCTTAGKSAPTAIPKTPLLLSGCRHGISAPIRC